MAMLPGKAGVSEARGLVPCGYMLRLSLPFGLESRSDCQDQDERAESADGQVFECIHGDAPCGRTLHWLIALL